MTDWFSVKFINSYLTEAELRKFLEYKFKKRLPNKVKRYKYQKKEN